MKNYVLGFSDISRQATITGGVWRDDLDTKMLKRGLLTAVAKTVDLTTLVLDITLGESKDIQVLGICNHNISPTGTYQWECFSDSGRTVGVYDSTTITSYEYDKSLIHKTTCDSIEIPVTDIYWRLTIVDAGNTEGFTKIGRLFIGERFDPTCNMSYGLKHGIDTKNTIIERSNVGIEAFIQSVRTRTALFTHKYMSIELGEKFFSMQMEMGVSEAVLYEFNPENKAKGLFTFVGRNDTINPLDYPYSKLNALAFNIKEII